MGLLSIVLTSMLPADDKLSVINQLSIYYSWFNLGGKILRQLDSLGCGLQRRTSYASSTSFQLPKLLSWPLRLAVRPMTPPILRSSFRITLGIPSVDGRKARLAASMLDKSMRSSSL